MSVIVTCAVTGGSHTPTMNSDIPITVDEHIDQSVARAEAGASVIHIHARDPEDGRPVSDVGIFREYCSGIKAAATPSSRSPPAAPPGRRSKSASRSSRSCAPSWPPATWAR